MNSEQRTPPNNENTCHTAWLFGAVHCSRALLGHPLPHRLAFWSCALLAGPVDVAWPLTFLSRPLRWPSRGLPVLLMRWRTQVEWQPQYRGCQCVKGCLLCRGGLVGYVVVVECHQRYCVPFGVDQAVLYYSHCLWTSGGLPVVSQKFLENGTLRGTGWCCCGCVLALLFRPSFQSIEYIKCTLLALAATPLQQTWLNESGWLSFTSWMSGLQDHLCSSSHLAS